MKIKKYFDFTSFYMQQIIGTVPFICYSVKNDSLVTTTSLITELTSDLVIYSLNGIKDLMSPSKET